MFNYSKLKGRIREVFGTQFLFADSIGMSKTTITHKLNNRSDWSQTEILSSCKALGIQIKEIPAYFFAV